MNKILGFMNVLLMTFIIIVLIVGGGGVEQRFVIIGGALTLVPVTFTMLALEPQARFLRTAIVTNALFIVMYFVGAGAGPTNPQNLALLPYVLNIAGLTRIWFRLRRERSEAAYASDAGDEALVPEPMPYPEELATNYFARHWLGQLSLPVSYWVNVWGATAVCAGLMLAARALLDDISLQAASAAFLISTLLLLVVGCWSAVGAWRSAGYHVARGGRAVWAVVVQFLVVIGAVGTVTNVFLYVLPQTKEHWLIVSGRDPLGEIGTELTRDGRGLVLTGAFGAGSASKVRGLLDATPEIETIVLESPGGRIVEAVRIAKEVRERKLDTYVETHCQSACTFVFLAGVDRAATATAQIGFHRAFFPGMDPNLDAAMTEHMLEEYRSAGLSDAFLARVRATQSSDMWYPTSDELVEARVVNRVSLGGESARSTKYESKAYLAFQLAGDPIMGAINDRFRGAVDAAAAAAWELYQRGSSDAAMWAAARKVILGYYGALLDSVNLAGLDAYLQIRSAQLQAARDVSDDACALQAKSALDIANALPKALYQQELSWVQAAIAASKKAGPVELDRQRFDQAMQQLTAKLSPEAAAVVGSAGEGVRAPSLVCSSTLELYEAMRALPRNERAIAIRGLFRSAGI